ncbi:hypothetical protein FNAPI_2734 [Fusarium napiforme]|uniref:Uncharacterized protein n=1 Tax=Fusarium napiforme TaxID=42672 RepID=A0A8H5JWL3_9HYPO|nr:hypothetical protein FNAPI_2734 [Fusarium napiforme]
MGISVEDLAPAVPIVSIQVPGNFNYEPTVLQPTLQEPLSRNPKTRTKFPKCPNDKSTSNLLQLNLTGETQVFSEVLLEHVPNRGFFNQADIDLIGRPYTQSIVDAMPNEDGTYS